MGVKKALLVMSETPLRHDGPSTRNDPGHSPSGEGNEPQQYAGMHCEVVDTLFGLLDQSVAVNFPSQFFCSATDFLERLIDWNGSDRNRTVPNDPFPRGVNVFSRRQIHHRICTPERGPTHLLDFFFDTVCNSRISDVPADLTQKIPPNDHWLGFRMIDVGRNNGTTPRHFVPHNFRGHVSLNHSFRRLTAMMAAVRFRLETFAAEGLPDCDVLHLWSNDAGSSVPELSHWMPG